MLYSGKGCDVMSFLKGNGSSLVMEESSAGKLMLLSSTPSSGTSIFSSSSCAELWPFESSVETTFSSRCGCAYCNIGLLRASTSTSPSVEIGFG